MLNFSSRARRGGFTLVEMLVTIGIIVVLGLLLLPGVNLAMTHARTAQCASNLRQIGVGMLAFAGEHNENLPESGAIIPHGQIDPVTKLPSWTEQLEPYLGKSTDTVTNPIYQCPDSSKSIPGNRNYSYFNGCHAAYAAAGGHFAVVNLKRIRAPSGFIISGDIAFDIFYDPLVDADKDDFSQNPAFAGGTANAPVKIPIHSGASNILFADGHVESLKYFDPVLETTSYQGPALNFGSYLWTSN